MAYESKTNTQAIPNWSRGYPRQGARVQWCYILVHLFIAGYLFPLLLFNPTRARKEQPSKSTIPICLLEYCVPERWRAPEASKGFLWEKKLKWSKSANIT